VNFSQLAGEFLDADRETQYLGRFLSCYVGHATEPMIRWAGSSGGIVTALLLAGLKNGFLDGALVTRMDPESPLKPLTSVARGQDEIKDASGSKYCVAASNLSLRAVKESEGRFAVVGLPCHVHGLRKAQSFDPELDGRIVLSIGLFCGMTRPPLATAVALRRRGVEPRSVKQIRYRGCGWPGMLQVTLRDGSVRSEPLESYDVPPFTCFFPSRCTLCSDGLAELADISCGDAWLPGYRSDDQGSSIVITRSSRGEDFLSSVGCDAISVHPVSPDIVVQAQQRMLQFKKRALPARAGLYKMTGRRVPTYVDEYFAPRLRDYPSSAFFLVSRYVCRWLAERQYSAPIR
jgi:coenzyme F420 hydrogenase subunit beta